MVLSFVLFSNHVLDSPSCQQVLRDVVKWIRSRKPICLILRHIYLIANIFCIDTQLRLIQALATSQHKIFGDQIFWL